MSARWTATWMLSQLDPDRYVQSVGGFLDGIDLFDGGSFEVSRRFGLAKAGHRALALPREFRDDVVVVARRGEAPLKQVAKDFGISESCLANWLRAADVEDGIRPGVTREESAELRELRKRNRLLEQENEVLRRAAAYLAGGGPAGWRGDGDGRLGRQWALPLADRVPLVATYWRTNLTMRQIGPLFGVSHAAAHRVIDKTPPSTAPRASKTRWRIGR
jgi:transposase